MSNTTPGRRPQRSASAPDPPAPLAAAEKIDLAMTAEEVAAFTKRAADDLAVVTQALGLALDTADGFLERGDEEFEEEFEEEDEEERERDTQRWEFCQRVRKAAEAGDLTPIHEELARTEEAERAAAPLVAPGVDVAGWLRVLAHVREKRPALAAIFDRAAILRFDAERVDLGYEAQSFLIGQASDAAAKESLLDALRAHFGQAPVLAFETLPARGEP